MGWVSIMRIIYACFIPFSFSFSCVCVCVCVAEAAAVAAVVAGFDVRETEQRTNLKEEGNKSRSRSINTNGRRKEASERDRGPTRKKGRLPTTNHNNMNRGEQKEPKIYKLEDKAAGQTSSFLGFSNLLLNLFSSRP